MIYRMNTPMPCADCGVQIGLPHLVGCDVPSCARDLSVQRVACRLDHEHGDTIYVGDCDAEIMVRGRLALAAGGT